MFLVWFDFSVVVSWRSLVTTRLRMTQPASLMLSFFATRRPASNIHTCCANSIDAVTRALLNLFYISPRPFSQCYKCFPNIGFCFILQRVIFMIAALKLCVEKKVIQAVLQSAKAFLLNSVKVEFLPIDGNVEDLSIKATKTPTKAPQLLWLPTFKNDQDEVIAVPLDIGISHDHLQGE